MNSQEQMDSITKAINDSPVFQNLFQDMSGDNQANYRYYQGGKSGEDRYFYTVGKIEHKGNMRYVAGIYRYLKTKKVFKLVKKVGFAKKHKAIEWARQAKNNNL